MPPPWVVILHGAGCSHTTLPSIMIMQAFLWSLDVNVNVPAVAKP
jgi:hypothetical protein